MAAPQLSQLHALSHHTTARAGQSSDDDRQQALDKACEVCLTIAHLGHALAAEHGWSVAATQAVAPDAIATASVAARAPAHFQARAPPSLL